MASPNAPKSAAELIREHSHASVIEVSRKQFSLGIDPITGELRFSRMLTDEDAVESLVRKFK